MIRRLVQLSVVVGVLSVLVAAPVFAIQKYIDCPGGVCNGTSLDDEMRGVGNASDPYTTDIIYGFEGSDYLYGQESLTSDNYFVDDPDTFYGGDNGDHVYGGGGDDTVRGGSGADYVYGGFGGDEIRGDADGDTLWGGDYYKYYDPTSSRYVQDQSGDQLYGGGSFDFLHGGNGSDRLEGGEQTDYLYGEAGNDVLVGTDDGYGGDRLNCGVGTNDVAYANQKDIVASSCERVVRR